ncbi:uncharacterized protein LOC126973498 [Leptidea sinapis]|uniref:uncharacterized protein LOC126973498 n=1 Tax=Leptidea sinapis TaxID=189913 RepID=UPI00213D5C95|nr:uncharacterized protein LOC126973498 [Leptidea sinapis]
MNAVGSWCRMSSACALRTGPVAMRWRQRSTPSRAKERANISFFIFIMFFAVFGVIVLTELLLLERPPSGAPRSRYLESLQSLERRTEKGGDGGDQLPPAHSPQDAVWQPVAGTRFKFYVYSAYMERRTVAAVRVIAATRTHGTEPVVCRIWLTDNRTVTVKARVKPIRENWNMKYSATYVLCLLRGSGVKPQETVGASVAVVAAATPNRPPTNLLTVLDTEPGSGIDETLHVCVKPFHFSYSRADWLMEWFELNRILGATHFYMYNESLSAPVACLLEHYRKQGLVTLLPWKLPIVSKIEIRTEGQFAAFNDCLYRSMSSAGWLLVIDVDEIVIPRRERTLIALLTAMRAAYNPSAKAPSAFLFRNTFFYMHWEDDVEAPAPLVTARKTRRWASPHAIKNRSKYALRPRDAVELGNHFLWEMAPGVSCVGVPIERALLHHYRMVCEYGGMQCLTVPSVVDRTAHRWAEELMQRITAEKTSISKTCPI